ncbi:uncharacterized protein LOC110773395 [Prunus avium]|uniref:Uncharacterized protein LOC110773395 n=1 Tax=Prunus avium TaxID=42229 RepID=A0A6P5U375_PRUAV|nr:uncharacterized protein LOC110773395 [Prunus avium]
MDPSATGLAGVGCVIRNSNGDLLGGESRINVRSAPIEAEAEAVLSGLHLAKEQGHHDVVLECDSQVVVQSLRDRKRAIPWKIYPFIQAIRRLVSWFSSIHWTWIPRTANKAAHVAATIANLRVRHLRWASQPPPSLVLVLSRDGLPGPPY